MKSIKIPVIQNGARFDLTIVFARDTRKSFEEIEQFVKKNCGNDAEIENPDKLKKRLLPTEGGKQ